jgi:hypothetical protein
MLLVFYEKLVVKYKLFDRILKSMLLKYSGLSSARTIHGISPNNFYD